MNDNKFHIRQLAKWREESADMFRKMGLREAQYQALLGELADIGTEKIVARASQFLFDFDAVGSSALAERHGVTDRAIRYWRTDLVAMNIGKKAVG
jgi:hypothetical protein